MSMIEFSKVPSASFFLIFRASSVLLVNDFRLGCPLLGVVGLLLLYNIDSAEDVDVTVPLTKIGEDFFRTSWP